MNRLKAFSSSPGALSHAFTEDMVWQAIKDWSLAQGTSCNMASRRVQALIVRLPLLSMPATCTTVWKVCASAVHALGGLSAMMPS